MPRQLDIGARRREWLGQARLYFIVEARPHGDDAEPLLRAALRGGVDLVQLREKTLDDRAIVRAGRAFRRLCDAYDALFIVNDRADLAIACGADGVHLGQGDAAITSVRTLVGEEALIGVSTHSPEQIAAAEGADYIGVGPIFATPTKPGHEPVGLGLVSHAARAAPAPFFAIGGIDPSNAADVVAAGAQRLAVVRAIRDAEDPAAAAGALRATIETGAAARL